MEVAQGVGCGGESRAKGKGHCPHHELGPAPTARLLQHLSPRGKLFCLWLSPTPLCSARPG